MSLVELGCMRLRRKGVVGGGGRGGGGVRDLLVDFLNGELSVLFRRVTQWVECRG